MSISFPKLTLVLILLSASILPSCRDKKAEKKLDPRLRMRLRERGVDQPENSRANVLMKSTEPLTPEQKQQLNDMEVNVQSQIGLIATASMPIKTVLTVARLDYITYIELSKAYHLQPEKNQ